MRRVGITFELQPLGVTQGDARLGMDSDTLLLLRLTIGDLPPTILNR